MTTKYGKTKVQNLTIEELNEKHLSTRLGIRKLSDNENGIQRSNDLVHFINVTDETMNNSALLLVDYQNDTLVYEGIDENEIIKKLAGSIQIESSDGKMSRNLSRLSPSLYSNLGSVRYLHESQRT